MKIGFHVLGKKGYMALDAFLTEFGPEHVAYVMYGEDRNIQKDWHLEVVDRCHRCQVACFGRNEPLGDLAGTSSRSFAIGWRWMLEDPTNLVVFHDSLLPKYRGFAPLVNMLISGEERIGVTAFLGSEEYDAGDILAQEHVSVTYPKKIAAAIEDVIPLYSKLVIRVGHMLLSPAGLRGKKQDERLASYSLWRDTDDYIINWKDSAEEIRRFVDATGSPYTGATSYIGDAQVRIIDVECVTDVDIEGREAHIGKVIFRRGDCPVVVCGAGLLRITGLSGDSGAPTLERIPFRTRFVGRP
jgi:methionyl-tRNA formyltransferase